MCVSIVHFCTEVSGRYFCCEMFHIRKIHLAKNYLRTLLSAFFSSLLAKQPSYRWRHLHMHFGQYRFCWKFDLWWGIGQVLKNFWLGNDFQDFTTYLVLFSMQSQYINYNWHALMLISRNYKNRLSGKIVKTTTCKKHGATSMGCACAWSLVYLLCNRIVLNEPNK